MPLSINIYSLHQLGIDPNSPYNVTERRMAALNGYITPVSFEVPLAKTPEAVMDKASELCMKMRLWKTKKTETKDTRNRRLLAIAEGHAQPTYYGDSADNGSGRRYRGAERKASKGGKRYTRKIRGKVAKADRLEVNAIDDLVWVVIMNADQGLNFPSSFLTAPLANNFS